MNPGWLRSIIYKHGNVGYVFVSFYMLGFFLWRGHKKPLCYTAVVFCCCGLLLACYIHAGRRQSPVVAQASYTLTDLGVLPNHDSSMALHVNADGQVVGWSAQGRDQHQAVLWKNGKIIALPALSGCPCSHATCINDKGQISGYVYTPDVYSRVHGHAVVWQNGKPQDLGTLGGPYSDAYGINNTGDVAGNADVEKNFERAFLYQKGKMRDLGALSEHDVSGATAINSKGAAVGYSQLSSHVSSVLFTNGKVERIPDLGGRASVGNAINDKGEVVGISNLKGRSDYYAHAFLWQPSRKAIDLGTLGGGKSNAQAINKAGQIVGWSYIADDNKHVRHACLWQQGRITDLNALLPKNSGWTLTQANGINDKGQIVGVGLHNGQTRAFLLTPQNR